MFMCLCLCLWSVYHLSAAAASLARGVGRYRAHVASGPAHIYEVQATICTIWCIRLFPRFVFKSFLGHLCLIMGKPQIGHFVAANEDFPEFKPPKVVRVGFVGYLTINYLPTHVLPNIILHYTFLHSYIIFQHHLTINHLPRRVTQHPTTTPILCMRWG